MIGFEIMTSVCWLVPDLGYYHHARLQALAARSMFPVHALEAVDRSEFAEFGMPKGGRWGGLYQRHTLSPGKRYMELNARQLAVRIWECLRRLRPAVLCVNGWSDPSALLGIRWSVDAGCPVVIMSDSSEDDERRYWWREAVKRRIVGLGNAALVGGARHRAYVEALGLPSEAVFEGYDVVDNEYFARGAERARADARRWHEQLRLPERFFLGSSRFVEKKNLLRLLAGYAGYCQQAGPGRWGLVLIGGGPLRARILNHISELDLAGDVILPGFKRYDELPAYYGLAGTFVHASTTEQWGLVVNEAMASGLPVIVSERCGCAPDLVRNGVNGFTFDPYDVEELARLMLKVASDDCDREAMGRSSQEIIAEWGPERFADGLMKAVEMAIGRPPVKAAWFDRALLWALAHR